MSEVLGAVTSITKQQGDNMPYIMRYNEVSVWFVGPFQDDQEALDWIDENNQEDDPRWNLVYTCTSTVVAPD